MTQSSTKPIELVVEKLRLQGYIGFWLVVGTGILLTRRFTDLPDPTLLTTVFGYNNVCVNFDYAPSTYVLPAMWAVTLLFLLTYIFAHWMQMRDDVAQGELSFGMYRTLSGLKFFEACTLIIFSTIFALAPEGPDHTLVIHTAPFFLLQIGMVSLAMSNTLHGIKSGYWARLELPSWFATSAKVYCFLFALIVLFKIPVATNAMLAALANPGQVLMGITPDAPLFAYTPTLQNIAAQVDRAFLVFAAAIPMAKAIYMLTTKRDKLEVVYLNSQLAQDRG